MKVSDILKETCIVPEMKSRKKEEAIAELVEYLWEQNLLPDRKEAERVVLEREKLGSTAIGEGIAIPHGKLKDIENLICILGITKEGIDFDSIDGKPVHLIFLMFAPEHKISLHLEALSKVSRILRNNLLVEKILKAKDRGEIYALIGEEDFDAKV